MATPEDSAPLPILPPQGDLDWWPERSTWDEEVKRRLEGYLSPEQLEAAFGGNAPRTTASVTTPSTPAGGRWQGSIELATGYQLLVIDSSAAARIRLHDTPGHQSTDATRAIGVDPDTAIDHGVMLDYVFAAAGNRTLSPLVDGMVPTGTVVPITVDNTGVAAAAITVTLTYRKTE